MRDIVFLTQLWLSGHLHEFWPQASLQRTTFSVICSILAAMDNKYYTGFLHCTIDIAGKRPHGAEIATQEPESIQIQAVELLRQTGFAGSDRFMLALKFFHSRGLGLFACHLFVVWPSGEFHCRRILIDRRFAEHPSSGLPIIFSHDEHNVIICSNCNDVYHM